MADDYWKDFSGSGWNSAPLGGLGGQYQYIPPHLTPEQLERIVAAFEKLAQAFELISNKYR